MDMLCDLTIACFLCLEEEYMGYGHGMNSITRRIVSAKEKYQHRLADTIHKLIGILIANRGHWQLILGSENHHSNGGTLIFGGGRRQRSCSRQVELIGNKATKGFHNRIGGRK